MCRRSCVVAWHFVFAESQRKLLSPIHGGRIFNAMPQCLIQLVGLLDDQSHRVNVSNVISPTELHTHCLFFGNNAALLGLRCPGQNHTGTYHVQPPYLDPVHQFQETFDIRDTEHRA